MAITAISVHEMRQMNKILRPKFGSALQVTSGSCEKSDGTVKYHLVIGDPINTPSQENLLGIGKLLKEKWDSGAEYYSGTQKIA